MRARRIVAVVVLVIVAITAMALPHPHPRAQLEITLSQASLLLEAGPLQVRALVSTGWPQSAALALSVGGVAR